MLFVDTLILIAGVLLLLGIASSKFSARLGVPVLVLFLGLGMLAGSEGIGGIDFENYSLAHGIGTLALVYILFDGGLSTPLSAVRLAWKPASVLATVGVLLTAILTGLAASYALNLSLLEGLLLGSIVGSTDAAAVFAILRSGGVHLSERLSATLEIESGSNDPMAVFLTMAAIGLFNHDLTPGIGLVAFFLTQMLVGAAVGLLIGWATVKIVNRINLDAAGLYPLLVSSFGLLAFGLAAALGGSGFLAAYIAGILIGNSELVFKRGIFLFHDAAAWLAQILMFVVLGLLSFPSRLWDVAWQGLLIAAALTFVARPLAVVLCALPFRYSWRELTFLSWVGLKGAVPITLATFPLINNIPGATLTFDVVFFVVVVSALIQGWSLPLVARWLNLEQPEKPKPPVTLEISSLRHVDGDIVDYLVETGSVAANRQVRDLALPEGAVIALIARRQQFIPPQGNTTIESGDHVLVVLRPEARPLMDRVFSTDQKLEAELPRLLEFPLRATTTVGDLEEFYGLEMAAPRTSTLAEVLKSRLGTEAKPDRFVAFGNVALYIRGLNPAGEISRVGMVILPHPDPIPKDDSEPMK